MFETLTNIDTNMRCTKEGVLAVLVYAAPTSGLNVNVDTNIWSSKQVSVTVNVQHENVADLRPFSCAFLLWSKRAASLKDTRRPVLPVDRKRSVSMSWELAVDKHSDSSTRIVISA